jgi:hypothetical protein
VLWPEQVEDEPNSAMPLYGKVQMGNFLLKEVPSEGFLLKKVLSKGGCFQRIPSKVDSFLRKLSFRRR